MNSSPSEDNRGLADLLGRLPTPAAPSPQLLARLQAARPAPVPSRIFGFRPLMLAAVLAALGTAAILLFRPQPQPAVVTQPAPLPAVAAAPARSAVKAHVEVMPPVLSQQHLLSMRSMGLVRDLEDRPVRLVECTWLDLDTFGSADKPGLRETALRREIVPVVLPIQ